MWNKIKAFVCAAEQKELSELQGNYDLLVNQRDGLLEKAERRVKEEERKEYWENKWPKGRITYKAQGEHIRDIRTLICDNSYLIEDFAKRHKLHGGTDDEKILKIQKAVYNLVKYTPDKSKDGLDEYWQDPELTLQRQEGDCEDGALLIKSIALVVGIPDYKVKICAGWVRDPKTKGVLGHAYCIYLADVDSKWRVIDWCFYPDFTPITKRDEHKMDKNYNPNPKSIWWTVTKSYSYTQEDVNVSDVPDD